MLYSRKMFKYGYFETRFKLPVEPSSPTTHQGFGPNLWLYRADSSQNNYWSEIDVFEVCAFHPNKGSNWTTTNVHYSDQDTSKIHPTHAKEIGNIASNVWHKASVWWTPEFINIYFNDSLINSVEGIPEIPVDSLVESFLFVDINAPTANYCVNFDSINTVFPYKYEIDYIRVYQLNQYCDSTVTICNLSVQTFESGLYESITFGGVRCSSAICWC